MHGLRLLDAYLVQRDAAVCRARAKRVLIAHHVRVCLFSDEREVGGDVHRLADGTHNVIERHALGGTELYIHHKEAAPSSHTRSGLVPCPGSCGTFDLLAPLATCGL